MTGIRLSIFALALVLATSFVILWLVKSGYFRTYPYPHLPPESTVRHFAGWTRPEPLIPERYPNFKNGLYTSTALLDFPPNATDLTITNRGNSLEFGVDFETRHDIETPAVELIAAFTDVKVRDAVAAFSSFDDPTSSSVGLSVLTSNDLELPPGEALSVSLRIRLPPANLVRLENISIDQHSGNVIFNVHEDTIFSTVHVTSPILQLDVQTSLNAAHSIIFESYLGQVNIRRDISAPHILFSVITFGITASRITSSDSVRIEAERLRLTVEKLSAPRVAVRAEAVDISGSVRIEGGSLDVDVVGGGVNLSLDIAPSPSSSSRGSQETQPTIDTEESLRQGTSAASTFSSPSSSSNPWPTWPSRPYPSTRPPFYPWPPPRLGASQNVNVSISNRRGSTSITYQRSSPSLSQQQEQEDPRQRGRGGQRASTGLSPPLSLPSWPLLPYPGRGSVLPPPALNSTVATQNGTVSVRHDSSFVGGFFLRSERGGPAELRGTPPPADRASSHIQAAAAAVVSRRSGLWPSGRRRVLEVVKDHSKGSKVWIRGVVHDEDADADADDDKAGSVVPAAAAAAATAGQSHPQSRTAASSSSGFTKKKTDWSEVLSDSGRLELAFD
ncbi:hypothetical protein V8E36_000972 [Tilletia maclaganii]